MTPEQLREACEVAGLETTLSHGSEAKLTYWSVYLPHCGLCWIEADVVKSCVADLLVAKLRTDCIMIWPCDGGLATAEQRITAAMKALGYW